MDDNEMTELAAQMEASTVLGRMGDEKTIQTRRGRGFKLNLQTGKYEAL